MRGDTDKWNTEKHQSLGDREQRGLNVGKDFLRVVTMDLKRKFTVIIFKKLIQNIPLTL